MMKMMMMLYHCDFFSTEESPVFHLRVGKLSILFLRRGGTGIPEMRGGTGIPEMRGGTGIPEAGRGTGLDDEDDDDAISLFFFFSTD